MECFIALRASEAAARCIVGLLEHHRSLTAWTNSRQMPPVKRPGQTPPIISPLR